MAQIITPQGDTIIVSDENAEQVRRVIDIRHQFILKYCKEKGWSEDPVKLTIPQILEIRSQDGWKNASADPISVVVGLNEP